MISANECRCGAEISTDRYVCPKCVGHLETALGDVPWVDEEIEVTITRQRSAGGSGGARSATTPLPWHERGSEARRALHSTLVTWVRFCDEERVKGAPSYDPDANQPRDTLTSMSRWLMHCLNGLATHELGHDAVDEITDAVAECRRIVFWKRRARVYLGRCGQEVRDQDDELLTDDCSGEVYADEGEPVGVCDECSQGVTVVIRKAEIDKKLDDHLCTAAELARWAVFLGLDVPRESVRKKVLYWHRHKRITEVAKEPETDAPMFRYREVKSLLFAEFGRESA